MAGRITILVTIVCLLIIMSCADGRKRKSRRMKRNHMTCRPRSLVRYQMTVHTEWDKKTFPKMFPTYRPPAHWSQLIGRSHGNNYRMWQEGGNASLAAQKFSERENAEFFDLELSQGYNGVLDAFVAPTIKTCVGQTSTVVSLDGRHSKVSFMMKIVPSPDWFIGLDSAELCYRGRWRKSYSRDLRPFDVGTDQGLTFTSPKWPNVPKHPISAITSSFPDHPASSFYYPEYKVLPRLAYVEFEMISEYRLRKVHKKIVQMPQQNVSAKNTSLTSQKATEVDNVFKNNEDGDITTRIGSLSIKDRTSGAQADSSHHSSLFSLISDPEETVVTSSLETQRYPNAPVPSTTSHYNSEPAMEMRSLSSRRQHAKRNPDKPLSSFGRRRSEYNTQEEVLEKQKDESDNSMKKPHPTEILTQDKLKDYQQRVDCQVSEWSEWSACSQTCGFGNKVRSREVITLSRKGGAHCPLLKEEELCGSMRNCQWKHFSLMSRSRKPNSPFKTLSRRRHGRIRKRKQ